MFRRNFNSPTNRFSVALFFPAICLLAVVLDLYQQQMTYHLFVNWPGSSTDRGFIDLVNLMGTHCDISQHRIEATHILEAWICDNVDWVQVYQKSIPHKIHVFSYLKPNFGNVVVLYSGILLPIWGIYVFLRLSCNKNPKELIFYGLVFCSILSALYLISKKLFYNFPLPHLYNPNDYLMDFWNVVFLASKGDIYSQKGFYHPLLIFFASLFESHNFQNAHQMRDQNISVSVVCGFTILIASTLNYLSIRKEKLDISSFLICFASAPIIFLISRLNLFFLAYILVSITFFLYPKKTKNLGKVNFSLSTFLPIIKPYFLIYYFLQNLKFIQLFKLIAIFVSLFILGAFLYKTKYPINSVNVISLPLDILFNTAYFAANINRPFFEVLSLNYSVFSYINIVNHKLSVLGMASTGTVISNIFLFVKYTLFCLSLFLITQNYRNLNERTLFMLFCIALLTFAQNIGGYVACILIPFIPEIRRVLNGKHPLFLAIIFSPIDFSAVIGSPNFISFFLLDVLNTTQTSFDVLPIRKDVSVMAILRPLALLWFWKVVISNGLFSRFYGTKGCI